MLSKIKNIIIFVIIGAVLVLGYIFFIKKDTDEANLISSSGAPALPVAGSTTTSGTSTFNNDFLGVLLNIKSIRLDDGIFLSPSFSSLRDSSILLIPDGTEGRPNPFAPLGSDITPISSNAETDFLIQNMLEEAPAPAPAPATDPALNGLDTILNGIPVAN